MAAVDDTPAPKVPAAAGNVASGASAAKYLRTPAAHVKLPEQLLTGLQQTPGGSARQGTITDIFELGGSDMPKTGTFGLACAASREARAVVYRALVGVPRVRRVAADMEKALLPHGTADDPRLGERSSEQRQLIVVHGMDAMDEASVARIADMHAADRAHVTVLASFDAPTFPTTCPRLETFGFALVRVDTLLPYARDEALSEVLQTQSDHFLAEVARFRHAGAAPALGRRSGKATNLPLRDTVVRALLSVPAGFRRVLKHIVARQSEVGEDTFMGVNALLDHLAAACDTMLPTARLRAMIRELESNRIVAYDPAQHATKVLQLPLVRDVLEEVDAAAAAAATGAGGAR